MIGGYGGPGTTRDFFMDGAILELDVWSWTKVQYMKGPAPKPRSDHWWRAGQEAGRVGRPRKAQGGRFPASSTTSTCSTSRRRGRRPTPPSSRVAREGYNPDDEKPVWWPELPTTVTEPRRHRDRVEFPRQADRLGPRPPRGGADGSPATARAQLALRVFSGRSLALAKAPGAGENIEEAGVLHLADVLDSMRPLFADGDALPL